MKVVCKKEMGIKQSRDWTGLGVFVFCFPFGLGFFYRCLFAVFWRLFVFLDFWIAYWFSFYSFYRLMIGQGYLAGFLLFICDIQIYIPRHGFQIKSSTIKV
ncbi:hypothetical protein FPQ18DRAFT_342338 [Pyronema domesticum]|nr:hypothetical protein FPQ18DRAFT_342338 [Pyronema domesticum]